MENIVKLLEYKKISDILLPFIQSSKLFPYTPLGNGWYSSLNDGNFTLSTTRKNKKF